MRHIRDYLLGRGEQNAVYPQSIVGLRNSVLECYGISNQYEDSYEKVHRFVEQYQIDIRGFAYDSERIPAIANESLEIHEFFAKRRNSGKEINVVACFNAIKNQDLLRYIDSQECVKNIYILDGFTYRFDWKNGSWEYRDIFISRKIRLVDSSCPFQRRITADFLAGHEDEVDETFRWLEDDLSRRTMAACFDGYISLQDFSMSHVLSLNDQYFDEDVIEFQDGEVFVDCGAFTGDSVIPFIQYCKNNNLQYGKIFAFEPDPKAFACLKKTTKDYPDCYAMQLGVGDKVGQYHLEYSYGASKLTENSAGGGNCVSVKTIDECLKSERVSFIKMDLDGGEMAALRGAKNTISRSHPKLAICIYHKPEDWITIPQYIKSLYSGYKFYCRGYFNSLKEIVLYAL